VGEQLEEEERMIGDEELARDFADAPSVLEFGDRGLDFGAPVVLPGEVIDLGLPIVRDVDLSGTRGMSRQRTQRSSACTGAV
jgi:hypothetical protein